MPHHVIVDGSNLATEGRQMPSLQQLNDVVMAFIEEQPGALITVVVDATFGHRINSSEVAEFDDAIANNELVAPPAGAIGRGDAFLLSVANKVGATVLSNDSFQEFHGTYPWLFEEGRLIGGKPVPHIGWVFVARSPVRGPISRSSVKEARRKKDGASPASAGERGGRGRRDKRGPSVSPEASQPMPIPKAPPPNATIPGRSAAAPAKQAAAAAAPAAKPSAGASGVNDFTSFLSFVEHHPIGTSVNATVESYSSHGAYVRLDGGVIGYLPLRLMADPPPRSAREFMKIGDSVTLVVESFAPARRSIDLAMTSMATAKPPVPAKRTRKSPAPAVEKPTVAAAEQPTKKAGSRRKKAATPEPEVAIVTPEEAAPSLEPQAPTPTGRKRGAKKATPAPAEPAPAPPLPAPEAAAPSGKRTRAEKAPAPSAAPAPDPTPAAPAKRSRAKKASAAVDPAAESAATIGEASPRARARRKPRT